MPCKIDRDGLCVARENNTYRILVQKLLAKILGGTAKETVYTKWEKAVRMVGRWN
jgi:hypothetical protein